MELMTKDEFRKWYWGEMDKLNELDNQIKECEGDYIKQGTLPFLQEKKMSLMEIIGLRMNYALDAFDALDKGETYVTIPLTRLLQRLGEFDELRKQAISTKRDDLLIMASSAYNVITSFIPMKFREILK